MYTIDFDFDCEGDPPHVFILDQSGTQVLEVFEEPTCTAPAWSWESDDWQPGPFTQQVLMLLNAYGGSPA